jgi:hypothetical protein
MRKRKKGEIIQERMRKWFRGLPSTQWAVDFETKTTCYEVKSCNLFNKCKNSNDKRKFVTKQHKQIVTHQRGRFVIDIENHYKLAKFALDTGKKAKYIFVVILGKQYVYKVKDWDEVHLPSIQETKSIYHYKSIEEIFGGKLK